MCFKPHSEGWISLRSRWTRLCGGLSLLAATALSASAQNQNDAARNDIELLLSELSFGGVATEAADDVPSAPPTPTTETEPSRFGPHVSSASDRDPSAPVIEDKLQAAQPFRLPDAAEPAAATPQFEGSSSSEFGGGTTSARHDAPVSVDFHEVFTAGMSEEPVSDIVEPVSDIVHSDLSGRCSQGCGQHVRPVLPPPSSFLGYFRSRPCNASVWSGYEAEYHAQCPSYPDYLNGPTRPTRRCGRMAPAKICHGGPHCPACHPERCD